MRLRYFIHGEVNFLIQEYSAPNTRSKNISETNSKGDLEDVILYNSESAELNTSYSSSWHGAGFEAQTLQQVLK